MTRYTVGRLARRFGLSRSTLLYYDSIGLLRPQGRASGEYRRYGPDEVARLERICLYRKAGLSLEEIRRALDTDSTLARALEERLQTLNREIGELRAQQRLILRLLDNRDLERNVAMSRARWTDLLSRSGFSEVDMRRWHMAFERSAPDEHQAFLEFLCIPEEDIRVIRSWKDDPGSGPENGGMKDGGQ